MGQPAVKQPATPASAPAVGPVAPRSTVSKAESATAKAADPGPVESANDQEKEEDFMNKDEADKFYEDIKKITTSTKPGFLNGG